MTQLVSELTSQLPDRLLLAIGNRKVIKGEQFYPHFFYRDMIPRLAFGQCRGGAAYQHGCDSGVRTQCNIGTATPEFDGTLRLRAGTLRKQNQGVALAQGGVRSLQHSFRFIVGDITSCPNWATGK